MYESYWQMSKKPFEPQFDEPFFFPGESHQGALLKLRYAIENRRGAVLLAGAGGCGKSMMVEMLRQQLDESFSPRVHLVYPHMPGDQLLAYLAHALGATPAPTPRHTVDESVARIETFLTENQEAGRHAVVALDEAHLLEESGALETVRLLLNLGPAARTSLTLVLVGQSTLLPQLERWPALEERLAVKTVLKPFDAEETARYIEHRLNAAGATREIFSPEAIQAVIQLSDGVPRRINRLCDLALLVGYAENRDRIDEQQIHGVSDELIRVAA